MPKKSICVLNKTKRGFTLIELLVVIAIIGLLASIVAVAVNKTRLKARNTRRVSDIRTLVNAFNMAVDVSGSLLPDVSNWTCVSSSCYGPNGGLLGWTTYGSDVPNQTLVNNLLSSYLPKFPADPVGGTRAEGGYLYNDTWPSASSQNSDGTCPGGAQTFYQGAYLDYVLEVTTVTSDICGPGRCWNVHDDSADHYIQCFVKLD